MGGALLANVAVSHNPLVGFAMPSGEFVPDRSSMSQPAAEPGTPHAHLEARRARLLERIGRPLRPPRADGVPLSRERIDYLVREAEDLYWNELAWEELTDEERVAGGHLTELVFPGFLAFIDALLLDGSSEGGTGGPSPHPEVVDEILLFLAERYAAATRELGRGADSERLVWARVMTFHLIDLVLYRLYGLTDEEREELERRE